MSSIEWAAGGLFVQMRSLSQFILVLAVLVGSAFQLEAAFIGGYAPGNFSLVNTEADGVASLQIDGSLLIIGPNNGSGNPGTTDFLIAALETGVVSFNFYYSAQDIPGFDFAGYILGGTFFQLADTIGTSGFVSFSVANGQIFGFRIASQDNTGEPGQLTISDFNAPGGATGVPEPSTWILMTASLAVLAGVRRRPTQSLGVEN